MAWFLESVLRQMAAVALETGTSHTVEGIANPAILALAHRLDHFQRAR